MILFGSRDRWGCMCNRRSWSSCGPSLVNGPLNVLVLVQANQLDGANAPVWNFFGYDEPNYTYAPNGKKLLGELGTMSSSPVYVRMHNLLTSGDGTASLKWGSTNAYS